MGAPPRFLSQQVSFAGVDGINGDTMNGVGEEWWLEGQSQGLEVALEPEVYFGDYSYVQVFPKHQSSILLIVGRDVVGLLGLR